MTTPQAPDFHRRKFGPIPPGSNRRTGWYMHLKSVNQALKSQQALQGDVIRPNQEIDLYVGAVIVQRRPAGTGKFAKWMWSYALAPPQGQELEWSPECADDRFITFRDNVAAALRFAPRDDANGYLPDPTLAAPVNFPRPPGPETALAMARFAYANRPNHPPTVAEIAELANSRPPQWLITLASESHPPAVSALAAALAFVCRSETPEPTALRKDPRAASAYWIQEDELLSLTADANGASSAKRRHLNAAARSGIPRRRIEALIPSEDGDATNEPETGFKITLLELRDTLNGGATPQ